MSKKNLDKKTKEIIRSLKSKDEKIALRALKSSKVHGNPAIFNVILKMLLTSESDSFKTEIMKFLNDLKSSDAVPLLIEAIQNDDFIEYRSHLIGVFWNSPLKANNYISLFVKHAIQDDFIVAMECATVVENIEPPFPEQEVNDSLLLLKEYFSQHPDEQKTELIKDILRVIKEMNSSVHLN